MQSATIQNFTKLFGLARDSSPAGRAELVSAVAGLYLGNVAAMGERERGLAAEILMELVRGVDDAVRQALAERLAGEPAAPKGLIEMLASDVPSVATPVLVRSLVLDDPVLMRVARAHGVAHQLAIAHRHEVSETLADALIEAGHPEVMTAVVRNPGAKISAPSMNRLSRHALNCVPLREPLLARPEVTPDVAARLYCWVSATLRQQIECKFKIPAEVLESALTQAVDDLLDGAKSQSIVTPEQEALAERLTESGSITAAMMIHVLRRGYPKLFQLLFGKLSRLESRAVKIMIAQQGGEALALACKALKIDKANFAPMFLLSRAARPGDHVVDPRELSRVLALYDRLSLETCEAVLSSWQQDCGQLFTMAERHNISVD